MADNNTYRYNADLFHGLARELMRVASQAQPLTPCAAEILNQIYRLVDMANGAEDEAVIAYETLSGKEYLPG